MDLNSSEERQGENRFYDEVRIVAGDFDVVVGAGIGLPAGVVEQV